MCKKTTEENKMSKFIVGDIIKAKPEWLGPRETGEERYIVLEDRGNKTLVQYIDVEHKFSLGSTHVYADEWMERDYNPSNEVLMIVLDMANRDM
jgi:hypothetical protein